MEEKQINEKESLLLIQQMIQTAKQEQQDNGMGWILWGWLLFAASVTTLLNLLFHWFDNFFFWNIMAVVAILLLLYEIFRNNFFKKPKQVRTYTGDLFAKLNTGFFIFLVLIVLSMNIGETIVSPVKAFALLMALYGFWMFIYGAVMNFKPSVVAAYLTWALALIGLFVNEFRWTMLLHAVAVFSGYIIPGHIANREFKQLQKPRKDQ